MPEEQTDYIALLIEFGTRLRDIEERQRLLKERTLLIGQNLLESRDSLNDNVVGLKKGVADINQEIDKIKSILQNLLEERENYARKQELEMLYRQSKIFDPLKFVTAKEIEKIIEKKLKEK